MNLTKLRGKIKLRHQEQYVRLPEFAYLSLGELEKTRIVSKGDGRSIKENNFGMLGHFSLAGKLVKCEKNMKFPDPDICRTLQLSESSYYWCMVSHPYQCSFSSRIGDSYFCNHPDRSDFTRGVEETEN